MTTIIHPQLVIRPADERGRTELGWLHSRHTFSFGEYYDEAHLGFRGLRVINDDTVEPGQGFGTHAHRDMEIFSYVIEGELEHKDSMGNGRVIRAGDLQYMSAGTGVQHSEFNPSPDHRVHFLQVWLLPRQAGGAPRYADRALGDAAPRNALTLLLSGQPLHLGRDRGRGKAASAGNGVIGIRANADVYFGRLDARHDVTLEAGADKGVWIHVIRGELSVLDNTLREGDGAAITEPAEIAIAARKAAEFLAFVLG